MSFRDFWRFWYFYSGQLVCEPAKMSFREFWRFWISTLVTTL
jgi:hypothetical protein